MPSLVDQNTVTITASQTSPLLLEGPGITTTTTTENSLPSIQQKVSGQNYKILDIDKLHELANLQNVIMDKNAIIYLGHYNVPDFSPVHLRIVARPPVDENLLKPPPIQANDVENESDSDFIIQKRSVEVQTDDDSKENIKHSIINFYWYSKNWINKQDNKGLKLALIIVVGCMISMFWYFKAQVRDIQQLSQGSTGFNSALINGPVTAYLEELEDGRMRVGKITFRPDLILGRGCEGTFVYK